MSYPHEAEVRPGTTGETAQAAADFMSPHLAGMNAEVLAIIRRAPATPEEITETLQRRSQSRVLLTTVRARVCGLRAMGLVVDQGTRGLGESGKVKVIRWRAAEPAETAAYLATKEARNV